MSLSEQNQFFFEDSLAGARGLSDNWNAALPGVVVTTAAGNVGICIVVQCYGETEISSSQNDGAGQSVRCSLV